MWGKLRAQRAAAVEGVYSATALDYAYARQSLAATVCKDLVPRDRNAPAACARRASGRHLSPTARARDEQAPSRQGLGPRRCRQMRQARDRLERPRTAQGNHTAKRGAPSKYRWAAIPLPRSMWRPPIRSFRCLQRQERRRLPTRAPTRHRCCGARGTGGLSSGGSGGAGAAAQLLLLADWRASRRPDSLDTASQSVARLGGHRRFHPSDEGGALRSTPKSRSRLHSRRRRSRAMAAWC